MVAKKKQLCYPPFLGSLFSLFQKLILIPQFSPSEKRKSPRIEAGKSLHVTNNFKFTKVKFLHNCFFFWSCVHYILSNFYFFIKWKPFKNHEKCFLFDLKSSFCSQDIQFLVFFSLPFHTFQIQKDKWKWNSLMSWISLHKFANVIFEITQQMLYITSSNLVR